MNRRQVGNKLRRWAFIDGKTNPDKHNIHGLIRHNIVMHNPFGLYLEGQQPML